MQHLPQEIIIIIMMKLRINELINLGLVRKIYNEIVKTIEWKHTIIFGGDKIFVDHIAFKKCEFNRAKENNCSLNSIDKSDRVLDICTSNTCEFKQIIKNISEVTSLCYIVFKPQAEEPNNFIDGTYTKELAGVRILYLSEDNNILLKMLLHARNFKYFKCDESKVTINMNMHSLCSALKTMDNNNFISMHINNNARDVLRIREINENNETICKKNIPIGLMKNFKYVFYLPMTLFQWTIKMKNDYFYILCKKLNKISTFVEIIMNGSDFLLKEKQDTKTITEKKNEEKQDTKTITEKNEEIPDQIIKGFYNIKDLLLFSKWSSNVNIYIKNDFPLVLTTQLGTLGTMYAFFASTNIIEHNDEKIKY
jgi:hypothetical protein